MTTTTKMATATNSSPGVKTQATHQRGITAAGLLSASQQLASRPLLRGPPRCPTTCWVGRGG